jgi:hypothetical protein
MLKLKINSKIFLAGAVLLGFSACKKELDVNLTNPNGITSAAISGKDVFANALQNTSANITNSFAFANQWMGYWARTTSYSASGAQAQVEHFNLSNDYGNGIWQSEYHNIYDYNFVISKSAENSILPGASKVMKALIYQNLADVFGDVPYSQAGDPNVSTQPQYEDAKTIYQNLIPQLDSAIASIKASQSTEDDAADIMFKGDKTKWVRFANTLKLRILMRQVPNGDQGYVQTEIGNIVSEGSGFLQAGEDAVINPGYADVVGKQNPFWTSYGFEVGGATPKANNVFYIANKTMIDYLNQTQDPRLGYLYDVTDGKNTGNYLGDFAEARPVSQLAVIGPGILKSAAMPAVIMPASESFFLQSEAAFRGLITGDYKSLLLQGIEESFRFLEVPDSKAAADNFFNNSTDPTVKPQGSSDPVKAIIYQKWVALAEINGLEAWSEYRRTGYPDRTNPSVATGVAVNKIPQRLLYPQSEYNLNSANVNSKNQQPSDIYTPIFWAKK